MHNRYENYTFFSARVNLSAIVFFEDAPVTKKKKRHIIAREKTYTAVWIGISKSIDATSQ